jgi:hypothetical protein
MPSSTRCSCMSLPRTAIPVLRSGRLSCALRSSSALLGVMQLCSIFRDNDLSFNHHSTCSTKEVLGEKGQRIRELTMAVQKRFGFPEGTVEMFAERVHNRGLSAMAQAESLKYKLLGGLQVLRKDCCFSVLVRTTATTIRELIRGLCPTGPKGMLRCHSLRYGERRARNRGYRFGQGSCAACEVNEVQVRIPHHNGTPSAGSSTQP